MAYKRLIEHRLPLDDIAEHSREKRHIADLHLWWARRPLAASRAGVFGTLVEDTQENYDLLKKILPWDTAKNGNDPAILEARRKVLEANGGVPPKVLDPFGGGGAIPLEALRLGCEVYSLDLNPVAYIIQRATLEFPQKFGQPNSRPVPEYIFEKDRQEKANSVGKVSAKNKGKATQQGGLGLGSSEGEWERAYKENPLATDVRYWGEWVLENARAELQEFYPPDEDGKIPVTYLWARTVTCTNPACRAEVPMLKSLTLSGKKGRESQLEIITSDGDKSIDFIIVKSTNSEKAEGTTDDGNATCPICSTAIPVAVVRQQAKDNVWGERLIAIVLNTPGKTGRTFRIANLKDREVFSKAHKALEEISSHDPTVIPQEPMQGWKREIRPPLYGISYWKDIFGSRQKLSLVKFISLSKDAYEKCKIHHEDEYSSCIFTYLGLTVDRLADYGSSISSWHSKNEQIRNTFARQAIPMTWDFAETNPLGGASGSWRSVITGPIDVIKTCSNGSKEHATVIRGSATNLPFDSDFFDSVVTDPPYYDAISYAELSDFFYVWLKKSIGNNYPEHFRTPLTPKAQEAIQNPARHAGNDNEALKFFENSMGTAFREMHRVLKPSGEATIVFAHKSTSAWEALISALIASRFVVEASWPLATEMKGKIAANEGRTMLASSTFLNCTKRTSGGIGYFQDVRRDMVAAIQPQLAEFWASGIRGADFFMSAIGPGLESYSKHDEVRRVSGEVVTVGEFLDEVRKIVMEFALEQVLGAKSLGAVDAATQFGLLSLWGYGSELPSDEARKLAQSVGIELSELEGLVKVSGDKAKVLPLKERTKNKNLGLSRNGEAVTMIDAMHKSVALLGGGNRQAVSDYLSGVDFLNSEAYWQTMQALAEVQDGADDGRALHELLTIRDNLPKPGDTAAQKLLGAN